MKLAVVNDPITAVGLAEGNTFTIAASAKAFDILSSNLYQNKILAVIREISCNAADAHTMVGKSHADISIHLPTFAEPYFSVRDYGPGLSHDNILKLYTTYFMSTKDSNNNLIGGFGLGSKSPFAVADQFVVKSWHGGFCFEYVMYKDAGLPKVNLIRQEPSAEPSGLYVQVAVDKSFSQWVEEAKNFFRWWSDRPQFNISADQIPPSLFTYPGVQSDATLNGFPVWKFCSQLNTSYALVGSVAYPINFSNIPNFQSFGLPTSKLLLAFNIGDVDITPSRESLSYDPTTCSNIIARMQQVQQHMLQNLQTELTKQPSLYAARQYVYVDNYDIVMGFAPLHIPFVWEGAPVLKSVSVDMPKDVTLFEIEQGWRSKIWKRSRDGVLPSFPRHTITGRKHHFFWTDNPKPTNLRKIYHYLDTNPNTEQYYPQYFVLTGISFAEASAFFEVNGLPPIKDSSTFADPPVVATSTITTKTKTTGYKINFTNLDYTATEAELNITNGVGGIYVPFFDGRPVTSLQNLRLAIIAKFLLTTEITGIKTSALAVAKRKTLLDTNNWVEYNEDWFAKTVKPALLFEPIRQKVLMQKLAIYANANAPTYGRNLHQIISKIVEEKKPLKNSNCFLPEFATLVSSAGGVLHYHSLPTTLSKDQTDAIEAATKSANELFTKYELFLTLNPMLRHVDWLGNFSLDSDTFYDYITR